MLLKCAVATFEKAIKIKETILIVPKQEIRAMLVSIGLLTGNRRHAPQFFGTSENRSNSVCHRGIK
jgi:hypothetical protein